MSSSVAAAAPFDVPKYWQFPPFFTLQPVLETREKQLKLWRELILTYHEHARLYSMGPPSSFPLFKNEALDRQLSPEGIEAVVASLVAAGEAEWEDAATRSNLLVYWKTPEALARDIASWAAQKLSKFDCVVAVVELHSDEDSPFLGVDPALIVKALGLLEEEGKCVIIGEESARGVKFSV